jgi:hypothetical protein
MIGYIVDLRASCALIRLVLGDRLEIRRTILPLCVI